MTSRSVEPKAPPTPPAPGNPLARAQAWVQATDRRLRRVPLVPSIQAILDTYNAAGGGITSSGLAYGALFAVIPGLLLIVSLLIIGVDNPEARQQAIDWITIQVPPLEQFAKEIVASVTKQARVGTVLGLVLFIWGASGFYLGLEGAMERLFPGPKRRDPIIGRRAGRGRGGGGRWGGAGDVRGQLVRGGMGPRRHRQRSSTRPCPDHAAGGDRRSASLVTLVVYLLVPADGPGWRAAWAPALAAGIGIGLLTSLFGLVSTYLVAGFNAPRGAHVRVRGARVVQLGVPDAAVRRRLGPASPGPAARARGRPLTGRVG